MWWHHQPSCEEKEGDYTQETAQPGLEVAASHSSLHSLLVSCDLATVHGSVLCSTVQSSLERRRKGGTEKWRGRQREGSREDKKRHTLSVLHLSDAGDRIQGFAHPKWAPHHWATIPVLMFFNRDSSLNTLLCDNGVWDCSPLPESTQSECVSKLVCKSGKGQWLCPLGHRCSFWYSALEPWLVLGCFLSFFFWLPGIALSGLLRGVSIAQPSPVHTHPSPSSAELALWGLRYWGHQHLSFLCPQITGNNCSHNYPRPNDSTQKSKEL